MSVNVRIGGRRDIPSLVEVERSDTSVGWSPWMDPKALQLHWGHIDRTGIVPLVAELDGKVVGHLDVVITYEPFLGSFLYLDVLMVHKAYRRKGIATALILEAEKLARKEGVEAMIVEAPVDPDRPNSRLYHKLGFKKQYELHRIEINCKRAQWPKDMHIKSIPRYQRAPLEDHDMICRVQNVSVNMWDYMTHPGVDMTAPYYLKENNLSFSIPTLQGTYYLHLTQSPSHKEEDSICLWVPTSVSSENMGPVLNLIKAISSALGAEKVVTYAFREHLSFLKKLGFQDQGTDELWTKKRL